MFLPADTENFAKAAQVELVQFLGMPPVASPSLAAVQETYTMMMIAVKRYQFVNGYNGIDINI